MSDPYSLNVNDPSLVNFNVEQLPISWVPEPSTLALLTLTLIAFILLVRCRPSAKKS